MTSEFKTSLEHGIFQTQVWRYTHLIWATPFAGGLHKDIGRRKTLLCLIELISTSLATHFFSIPA